MRILVILILLPITGFIAADESTVARYRFESQESLSKQLQFDGAQQQTDSPGHLIKPVDTKNLGSVAFNGTSGIVRTKLPSNAAGLVHDFTWEGFFLSPSKHACDTDGAVGDRFLSSFLDEKGGSTRLTIGLSMIKGKKLPHLCIALASTTNHHAGNLPVIPDIWHHFALVHEGTGTSGTLTWYLDYEQAGQVKLTGESPRATLPPAGIAPFQIGARLKSGGKADRGFQGSLDEIRLSGRALKPYEFLRVREVTYERNVAVHLFEDVPSSFDWDLRKLTAIESINFEAVSFAGLPRRFSERGFAAERRNATVLSATHEFALPQGEYEFLVRAESDAILTVDGQPLIKANNVIPNHPLGNLPRGQRDYAASFKSDGKPHQFQLAARFAATETENSHDVIVCYAQTGSREWRLLGHSADVPISTSAWAGFRGRLQKYYRSIDADRRLVAIERGNREWDKQHERDRQLAEKWKVEQPVGHGNPIDLFLELKTADTKTASAIIDDEKFLRRTSLDLLGRIPTRTEYHDFMTDEQPTKRDYAIDRMLASEEWADAWVGYWQDVLAENPTILKPDLNNSGAFRWWIHDSMRRNLPMDRFATELILMDGNDEENGTAGFAKAARNDVPMAMKAHIVIQAFLAADMKCARCHDSPSSPLTQRDLFSLAALLNEDPIKVPSTSVVPQLPGGRKPEVTSSLKPGDTIQPGWSLSSIIPDADWDDSISAANPRAQLANIITTPKNPRFSDVIVNRVWKRLFGIGLIDSVDNWSDLSEASHPQLLRYLSWQFVDSGYDLKKLVRLMVTSSAYQRSVGIDNSGKNGQPSFAAQHRRRMTAEQVVDSIHTAAGKQFDSEELTFDPNNSRGFLNLGQPARAWHMTSMSNERDRPALAMPINQSIVDVMSTFGWRETRPNPLTNRDHSPNPVQPLMIANGLMSQRMIRLTEESPLTELCLEDLQAHELVRELFIAALSRQPNSDEESLLFKLIGDSFEKRQTGKPKPKLEKRKRARVDWEKHLKAEASVEILESERLARQGEPPTIRLTTEFRERVEDGLWVLFNSPEFVFVP